MKANVSQFNLIATRKTYFAKTNFAARKEKRTSLLPEHKEVLLKWSTILGKSVLIWLLLSQRVSLKRTSEAAL